MYCSGCDPLTAALITRDRGNEMNNPLWLLWGRMFGWGDNGYGYGRGCSPEIESLRNQISDAKSSSDLMAAVNNNQAAVRELAAGIGTSVDFVRQGVCALGTSIEHIAGEMGMSRESVKNAVIMGEANVTAKLQQCCCENKMLTQQLSYESQLREQGHHADTMARIDQLAQGITQGFSATAYEAARHASEIMSNQDKNTQRILDQMCADKAQALRDLLAEKDRELLLYKLKSGEDGCGCCK